MVTSQFWPLTVVVVTRPETCMNLPETVTKTQLYSLIIFKIQFIIKIINKAVRMYLTFPFL